MLKKNNKNQMAEIALLFNKHTLPPSKKKGRGGVLLNFK
jgi:hypothetical protein